MWCKSIGAVVLIGTTIGLAPVAHADLDSEYINNLKGRGLYPADGVSESDWESGAIQAVHTTCAMATEGLGRDGIKAHEYATHPNSHDTINNMVDAAIATYCPQYW
jgi:Protein of unknown function (DUF732)